MSGYNMQEGSSIEQYDEFTNGIEPDYDTAHADCGHYCGEDQLEFIGHHPETGREWLVCPNCADLMATGSESVRHPEDLDESELERGRR